MSVEGIPTDPLPYARKALGVITATRASSDVDADAVVIAAIREATSSDLDCLGMFMGFSSVTGLLLRVLEAQGVDVGAALELVGRILAVGETDPTG